MVSKVELVKCQVCSSMCLSIGVEGQACNNVHVSMMWSVELVGECTWTSMYSVQMNLQHVLEYKMLGLQ
jgi:hypothetical protein